VGALTLLGIVALTSLGACLVATRRLGLRRAWLRDAIGQTLECLGLAVVFLTANLSVGMALVLGLRASTGQFISIYGLSDIAVAALSLLQALVFQHWRRAR
jgi:hypothetical protein